jgi:hypothetical protein
LRPRNVEVKTDVGWHRISVANRSISSLYHHFLFSLSWRLNNLQSSHKTFYRLHSPSLDARPEMV